MYAQILLYPERVMRVIATDRFSLFFFSFAHTIKTTGGCLMVDSKCFNHLHTWSGIAIKAYSRMHKLTFLAHLDHSSCVLDHRFFNSPLSRPTIDPRLLSYPQQMTG